MATFTKDCLFLRILSSHPCQSCVQAGNTPQHLPPSLPAPQSTADSASARQDMPPAGRVTAIPRGTSFPQAEETEGEVPPFSHPTRTPRSPTASLSISGLPSPSAPAPARRSRGLPPSLVAVCWQATSPLPALLGQSTFTPTTSRLSSPLGEGESSVAPGALSFPVSPSVSCASLWLTRFARS